MKIKTTAFIMLSVFGTLILPGSVSAQGTTLPTAFTANLGVYTGTLGSLDLNFYNFTASDLQTYNITLSGTSNNYMPLTVLTKTGAQIASNTTSIDSKSLVVTGHDFYIIRINVGGNDLSVYPLDYTLTISLAETAIGKSAHNAYIATEGLYSQNFTGWKDFDVYNFTASKTEIYNITLAHTKNEYFFMDVFDKDLNLIDQNFKADTSKYLLLSGYTEYVIALFSSEFVNSFPATYKLVITKIGQGTVTETTTVTKTVATTETKADVSVSIQTSTVASNFVPFPAFMFFISFVMLGLVIKYKRSLKFNN